MMRKSLSIIVLALMLLFVITNKSYAIDKKSIVILLDELDLDDASKLLSDVGFGIGFMNLKTRKPYSFESLYFSIGVGRKVGVESKHYKGLYKDIDGSINIIGFKDMLDEIYDFNHIDMKLLGNRLRNKGISYMGNDSSAIIGADDRGRLKSGEIELVYDEKWLIDNTNRHLSKSQILILSYNIDNREGRLNLLKNYIKKLKGTSILIVPKSISGGMRHIINRSIVPVAYIDGNKKGMLQSISTNREGFITLEDISVELLNNSEEDDALAIGNRINILKKKDSISHVRSIFKRTINLMAIAYLFHGLVCIAQVYSAYYIYRGSKEGFDRINFYNHLIVVNIFISILMGISNLHINIALYLFINLLTTYLVTVFIMGRAIDPIGLFATLTYILIIFGIFFNPEILYNSYIGFNNLFYGVRYYGLNNGIMGVLLASSIVSYLFIRKLISSEFWNKAICIAYFMLNIIALSANYGANTGGFITSTLLFLIMIYIYILDRRFSLASLSILIFIGLIIFISNMYFDYLSTEKSHAIDFLLRLKTLGIGEVVNIYRVKVGEFIKLTILPPFSVALISQIYSLERLFSIVDIPDKRKGRIILIVGLAAFLLNDTGIIAFIYMLHYLISLWVHNNILSIPKT